MGHCLLKAGCDMPIMREACGVVEKLENIAMQQPYPPPCLGPDQAQLASLHALSSSLFSLFQTMNNQAMNNQEMNNQES